MTKKVQSKQFNGKIIVDLSDTSVEEIVIQYQRFFNLCQSRGDLVKSLLFECPYYSITIWNSFQGHPDSSVFDHSYKGLHEKITELNDKIKCLNSEQGIISPRFSTDMIKCRKLKKSYSTKPVSYSLLLDGIHPGITLSRYWIRRIVIAVIFKYCY